MNNRKRCFYNVIAVAMCCMILWHNYEVLYAAPEIQGDAGFFDKDYYVDRYPEVANQVGADGRILYQHYIDKGIYNNEVPFYDLSFRNEVNFNQERIKIFGAAKFGGRILQSPLIYCNAGKAYLYSRQGAFIMKENQLCYVYDEKALFDAERYGNDNPDLLAIFGHDASLLWNHYKTQGVYEGRKAYALTDEANARLLIVDVAESITNENMSDEQKIYAVHNWMAQNITFDKQAPSDYMYPSYDITGAMLNHKAVCIGYSYTFEYFMSVLDIYCEIVGSDSGNHGWNRVLLNGEWKYIDVTWDDDDVSSCIFYDNYLVSYSQIKENHPPIEEILKVYY